MNPTPIFINNTRTVECIVQDGRKYCETSDTNPRLIGVAFLVLIAWGILLCWTFSKAIDKEGAWWLLPLTVLLAPFILMVIAG